MVTGMEGDGVIPSVDMQMDLSEAEGCTQIYSDELASQLNVCLSL